jgi:hypothetical protein
MEDPYDLHKTRPNDAIEQDVHRLSHSPLGVADTCMSKVKAAYSARQLGAVARRHTIRLSRDFAHGGRQERGLTAPAFESASLGADSQDLRKIGSRQR